MPQVLKQETKVKIYNAALSLFAEHGYQATTMSLVAQTAGVATGNIYKYYANKATLFDAIITPEFVAKFNRLTRKRVAKLIHLQNSESMLEDEAGQLLKFWIDHRLQVIILLARAQGSKYQDFQQQYIQAMTKQTMSQLPTAQPNLKNDDVFKLTFNNRLADTVRGIVSILQAFDCEQKITAAFAASWAYHYAGIQALIDWSSQTNNQPNDK